MELINLVFLLKRNFSLFQEFEFHQSTVGLYRHQTFKPNENSLKQHETPNWWKDAKLGIFIHWGLYSVPGFAPTQFMFR